MTELVGRVSMKNLVRESTDLIERLCIEAALRITRDNRASAAEMLGLSRQGLYAKMRRYGIGDLEGRTSPTKPDAARITSSRRYSRAIRDDVAPARTHDNVVNQT